MNRLLSDHKHRRGKHGAAMVEALLSYFVLFLILFGMLHIFYFFTGQFFADYAALRGARSRAVGFADYLVKRESRVTAIGGSGLMVYPGVRDDGLAADSAFRSTQFDKEKTLIQRFRSGFTWLEYEFWYGNTGDPVRPVSTHLNLAIKDLNNQSQMKTVFKDYSMPLSASGIVKDENGNVVLDNYGNAKKRGVRLFLRGIDLKGNATLANHSKVYLED